MLLVIFTEINVLKYSLNDYWLFADLVDIVGFPCSYLFWLSAVESALLEGSIWLISWRMVLCLFPYLLILHDTFDLQLSIWWVFHRHLKHSPLRFTVLHLSCTDIFFEVWQSETLQLSWHYQHLTVIFDSAILYSSLSVVIAKLL